MRIFICYSKCSTCAKARSFLTENNISFTERDIKENNPTYEELKLWTRGHDLKKFFNTSGLVYKSLGLKDKLASLSDDEKLKLLASDGMLVKRPLLIGDEVIVGFDREKYAKIKK